MTIHLYITKEWELNFPPGTLFPSQSANSNPEPGSSRLQALGTHVSSTSLVPTQGSNNTGCALQARRKGRARNWPEQSFLDRPRKQSLVNARSPSVRKEGPLPNFLSLSCPHLLCHYIPGEREMFPVRGVASQPFGSLGVDLGHGPLPVSLTHCI